MKVRKLKIIVGASFNEVQQESSAKTVIGQT
jgi:hypothetical protein